MTTTATLPTDRLCPLAEHSSDVIAQYDREGRQLRTNEAYRGLFHTVELDICPLLLQAPVGAKEFTTQTAWTDAQGMARRFDVLIAAQEDDKGGVTAWWLAARDRTEEHELHSRLRQLEDELHRRNAELRALMEHSPDSVARYDHRGRCLYANPTFLEQHGVRADDIHGKPPADHSGCPSALHLQVAIQGVVSSNETRELEYAWTAENGRRHFSRLKLVPEHDAQGQLVSVLAIGRDITDHKESLGLLERAESLARMGHWEWDFTLRRSVVSEELCRLLGKPISWQPTPEQSLAESPAEDRERICNLYKNAFAVRLSEVVYTQRIQNAQGDQIDLFTHVQIDYGPAGPLRLRGTSRDITELKRYETRLNEIALQDPLTGLPNRAWLTNRLETAIADAQEEERLGGLLLLNLDRFKEVNDILGHGHGDSLLIHCAQRLQQLVRAYDTVARLGSDEFAILLPHARDPAELLTFAEILITAMAQPFHLGEQPLFITCSIGIAQFPGDGANANELLQHADSALTEARARGRSRCHLYSADLTERSRERAQLGIALRRAEAQGELEVYYQPKVSLAHGTWTGAEALLRWNHPEAGLVTPDRFIALAEESGLIVGIGTWVLNAACSAASEWNRQAAQPFKVAVNLSPVQFRQDDLVGTVRRALATTGCAPAWLELEITENLLLDANENVRTMLCELREMGITVAIDDFGTGYSSLAYLKRFPIDVLKIDRTFVRDIGMEHNSTELTKAIVSIGRSLGMQLVAEGVESDTQAAFLLKQGCHSAQGYLYGKPMPKALFESQWDEKPAPMHA